ncbi:MAG TPA: CAP domain-containing protein [Candidatus Acidoferrum sp.]|nr:CAP domain-containing protein [Candidatus Acidoferrum sp.]
MLVAFGLLDHREQWNVVSVATLSKVVAMLQSNPAANHVAPPVAVAVHASAKPTAPAAVATNMPAPAEYAHNVGAIAVPHTAPTPPAVTSLSVAASSSWIDRINFFRTGAGLSPIRENSDLSAAAAAHAHYLLLNFSEDIRSAKPMSTEAYEERPGKSGYSAKGATAAPDLQLAWGCSSYDVGMQIDHWIEGPFHRLAMLDPFLSEAGFGQVSSDGCWVAALRLPPPPEEVKPYVRAVEFPPDGAAVALDWLGLEAPDPLDSCPGYDRPVGLPITLQIGMRVETRLTAHSLMADGKLIEHCVFDAPSYLNADPKSQEYGRWNLRNAGAIVIVPRAPLRPDVRYSVSIIAHDRTYAWSFTVAENQATTFIPLAPFPTTAPIASPAVKIPSRSTRLRKATPAPAVSPIALETPAIVAPPSSRIATAGPATIGSGANWLAILNLYRERLKLQPVEEDPALSHGCRDHARYIVTNFGKMVAAGMNPGSLMHNEDESKPGYTPDGVKAARASDVIFQPPQKLTDEQRMTQAVEYWMSGPFHRPSMVNPELRQVGFGEYCGEKLCAAALDWRSDLEPTLPGGHPYATPVEVPPDGATVKPSGYGNEWPSPIAPCTGYPNSSPAITLSLGINMAATLGDASLTQTTGAAAGTKVGTCAYDFQKYTNPDAGTQAHGREVLQGFAEVVMMVRDPLIGGESYRVDMTVNGKPYRWSFTVVK